MVVEPFRIDALPHTKSILALALSASMADGLADRCADQLDCEVAKVGRHGGNSRLPFLRERADSCRMLVLQSKTPTKSSP
jgi:hypothetical protein